MIKAFKNLTVVVLALSFSLFSQAEIYTITPFTGVDFYQAKYPNGPDATMTPGKLCDRPDTHRYEENIPYCERNVSSALKNEIIRKYDEKLGFSIRSMPRGDFKIDHFIPLSIGGSNDITNLWPQHKSVYSYSDPIESKLSELMVAGKIKQVEAIRVIKECKLNLDKCNDLYSYLNSLMH